MAFGWSKVRYSPIAIDFGADSLKVLQLVLSDTPQIVAAAAADVPEHARSDAEARRQFYIQSLKSLLKMQPFKGKRAIISLPAHQTLVQQLQIPRGEGDAHDAQVAQHFRERLNIDPRRMVIRTWQVGQVVRDGAARIEVICVAASRDVVMKHIEAVTSAHLNVVGMHSEPTAIVHAFSHLYRRADDANRTTAFVDLGSMTSKVVIAHGKEMAFAKLIHAAGDHMTQNVAKARKISFSEARQFRIQAASQAPRPPQEEVAAPTVPVTPGRSRRATTGIPALDAQLEASQTPSQATATAVKPTAAVAPNSTGPAPADEAGDTLECLIDELQLCVRYHQSVFNDRPIEKLVFLGGESHHLPTCQAIAKALRIGAQLGDPLARISRLGQGPKPIGVDLRRPQPGWAVPMGLCLCEPNL